MRFNISLLLAVATTTLHPSSTSASTSASPPSTPLASLAAASKRAFVTKTTSPTTNDDTNDVAIISTTAQDMIKDLPSGGATESQPLSQAPHLDNVADAPLMSDIEMLSNMLAEVVKKENPTVYDFYTRFRSLGMDRAANPNDVDSFEQMKKLARDISPKDALGVMKTFSIALNLVNAAEVHHRMRLVRENEKVESQGHNVGPLPMVEDSIRGTMEILEEEGVSPDEIFNRLITQKCEIVLTAHPTEVNRKTIIRKCEFCLF